MCTTLPICTYLHPKFVCNGAEVNNIFSQSVLREIIVIVCVLYRVPAKKTCTATLFLLDSVDSARVRSHNRHSAKVSPETSAILSLSSVTSHKFGICFAGE